jgi:RNA polymerase sigma factor (sigma-70 family)
LNVTVDDQQLATPGVAGETAQQAFLRLYDEHARSLLAFLGARVARIDLEDVHQEIWQRVWQGLVRSPAAAGENVRAWIFRIARNYLVDRSRKKQSAALAEATELSDDRAAQPEARLIEQERSVVLGKCLKRLTELAQALVRARLAGRDYDEVCGALRLTPARAHKIFHQAKVQLQNCVQRGLP